jgi:hypothetical protein
MDKKAFDLLILLAFHGNYNHPSQNPDSIGTADPELGIWIRIQTGQSCPPKQRKIFHVCMP